MQRLRRGISPAKAWSTPRAATRGNQCHVAEASPAPPLEWRDDTVVRVTPALARVGDLAAFLNEHFDAAAAYGPLRKAELIGRPVGAPA